MGGFQSLPEPEVVYEFPTAMDEDISEYASWVDFTS